MKMGSSFLEFVVTVNVVCAECEVECSESQLPLKSEHVQEFPHMCGMTAIQDVTVPHTEGRVP